jgi:hypothetical protein
MSITITLDNLSKFNKRAHDQLVKLDPSLKLSGSSEILARILGFNDVHHEQKALTDKAEIQIKDTALDSQHIFITNVPTNADSEASKKKIDELFDLANKLNISFIIDNDNAIRANVYKDIWITIRFGKHQFIKPAHYDTITRIDQLVWEDKSLDDAKINDILTLVHNVTSVDEITNAKSISYNKNDFRYFVGKLKEKEIEKKRSVRSTAGLLDKQSRITVSTPNYIFYTDKTTDDLKIGINRLNIIRYEKIAPSVYSKQWNGSVFAGVQEEESEYVEDDDFDIITSKFGLHVHLPMSKSGDLVTYKMIDADTTKNFKQGKDGYFEINVKSIDEFNSIDMEYDKWLRDEYQWPST